MGTRIQEQTLTWQKTGDFNLTEFYFPKILVSSLPTKTNYQAPVKNCRWSSQAIAAETSPGMWYDAHQC